MRLGGPSASRILPGSTTTPPIKCTRTDHLQLLANANAESIWSERHSGRACARFSSDKHRTPAYGHRVLKPVTAQRTHPFWRRKSFRESTFARTRCNDGTYVEIYACLSVGQSGMTDDMSVWRGDTICHRFHREMNLRPPALIRSRLGKKDGGRSPRDYTDCCLYVDIHLLLFSQRLRDCTNKLPVQSHNGGYMRCYGIALPWQSVR